MFIDLKTVTHMFLYAAAIASVPLSGAVRPIYVQAKFIPKIPAYPFARKSRNFGLADNIAPVKAMEHCSFIRRHEGIGFRQGDARNICKYFLI